MTDLNEDPTITEIKNALHSGDAVIALVPLILGPTDMAVQVKLGRKRVGPLLVPNEGEGLSELLGMLGKLVDDIPKTKDD